jgi:hypothetical protein
MSVWAWVAGIVAAAAIIFLLANGSDDRTFAGRDRQAFYARSVLSMVAMPPSAGAEDAVIAVESTGKVPQDVVPTLDEVKQLLATAATQSADQQKATLQQAHDKLGTAISQIEQKADDTSNQATKIYLLRQVLTLKKVQALIQTKLDRL